MSGLVNKGIAYFLLLLMVALSSVAVQAQQPDGDLVATLQEARDAGVSEAVLDRLLALGYEKQVEPSTMRRFLTILTQCQKENIPLQPFVSKIEEGFAKKVPTARIEQVLSNKLEDYRFTRSLIEKFLKRHGKAEPITPEYLVRLAETLYCGVSRQDLDQLLGEFPLTPLPMVARGAELLASLKQIQFDPKLSEQIVDSGVKQGYFTAAQKDFARIVMVAKDKGLSDDLIAKAALIAIETGESQTEFSARLGFSPQDLERLSTQLGATRPARVKPQDKFGTDASEKGRGKAAGRGGDQASSSSAPNKGSDSAAGGGSGVGSGSAPDKSSASAAVGGSGGGSGSAPGSAGDPASTASRVDPTTETSLKLSEAEQPPKKKPVRFAAAGAVADFSPEDSTLTLRIERANRVLKKRIGEAVRFVISDNVKVKGEGSEPGLFDLDLNDIRAGESYVRVLGKKLAGRVFLVTHLVISVDEAEQQAKTESTKFTVAGIATNIDPVDLKMSLEIEKGGGVLSGVIGDVITFNISEEVEISAESSESTLFGLSISDVEVKEGYLRIQGEKLAGGDYLITRMVILLDE